MDFIASGSSPVGVGSNGPNGLPLEGLDYPSLIENDAVLATVKDTSRRSASLERPGRDEETASSRTKNQLVAEQSRWGKAI
jgi:hypothetical protein